MSALLGLVRTRRGTRLFGLSFLHRGVTAGRRFVLLRTTFCTHVFVVRDRAHRFLGLALDVFDDTSYGIARA